MEVIISVALIALLMTALMTFYWESAKVRDQAAAQADRTQIARQVLNHIAAELRGCVGFDQVGFPVEQRLRGTRREISFLTTALPSPEQYQVFRETDDLPPGHHDLRQVDYKLWIDEDEQTEDGEPVVGGILRKIKRTLNQFIVEEDEPEQLRTDLWSHELAYLEFRYFDGAEWDIQWDITEGNSLPQLVQVIVGFESVTAEELEDADLQENPLNATDRIEEWHPDRYSVIVRIPAADRFFSSRFQRVQQQLLGDTLGVEGLQP